MNSQNTVHQDQLTVVTVVMYGIHVAVLVKVSDLHQRFTVNLWNKCDPMNLAGPTI